MMVKAALYAVTQKLIYCYPETQRLEVSACITNETQTTCDIHAATWRVFTILLCYKTDRSVKDDLPSTMAFG